MAGNEVARINENVTIEDAEIIFRNFAGKEGQYNREGDRNFCVKLDREVAERMKADGWNIKQLRAREEGEEPEPYIQVSVGYKVRPPIIALISSKGRRTLSEDMLELLDWVDIRNVDLIIRPYNWAVNGNTGVKAYVKSIFITIQEDYLELKYADFHEIESVSEPLALDVGASDDIIDAEIVEDDD